MYCDGGGLYLQVTKGGDAALHRSWLYRFAIAGRERQMGLGSFPTVGIAEARAKAADARKLVAERWTLLSAGTLYGPPQRRLRPRQ
jgi:Arm DNA-binding domain